MGEKRVWGIERAGEGKGGSAEGIGGSQKRGNDIRMGREEGGGRTGEGKINKSRGYGRMGRG